MYWRMTKLWILPPPFPKCHIPDVHPTSRLCSTGERTQDLMNASTLPGYLHPNFCSLFRHRTCYLLPGTQEPGHKMPSLLFPSLLAPVTTGANKGVHPSLACLLFPVESNHVGHPLSQFSVACFDNITSSSL